MVVCDCSHLHPHVQCMIRFSFFHSSVLWPKGVTEVLHQEATDRYMIGVHVTVNPLMYRAVVTVIISWGLSLSFLDHQSLSQPVDRLCFSPWGALIQSRIAYYWLCHLWKPLLLPARSANGVVGQGRNCFGAIRCHPTFCMKQTIRRDQIWPCSNNGGHFMSHLRFMIQTWSLLSYCPLQTAPLSYEFLLVGCPDVSEPEFEWQLWHCYTL